MAQLVGEAPERVMGALEESMAAGLVVEQPDSIDVFSFSHALVREALYGRLSVSRRVRLHHGVAEALEALAAQRERSTRPSWPTTSCSRATSRVPARRAATRSRPANARRELLAYEEAVEHYAQAAALFDDDDEPARCEVLLALGRAQWRAGHDGARSTFRTAADCAARRGDGDQLARAALGHSARYHEAGYDGPRRDELLDAALAALGDGRQPAARPAAQPPGGQRRVRRRASAIARRR